jgi:hypothetical protein
MHQELATFLTARGTTEGRHYRASSTEPLGPQPARTTLASSGRMGRSIVGVIPDLDVPPKSKIVYTLEDPRLPRAALQSPKPPKPGSSRLNRDILDQIGTQQAPSA